MNALSAEIHPDLVDRMIESYCDWRTDCAEVHAAYARFLDAPASDRAPAFAAYIAAVDREQCACEAYAAQVQTGMNASLEFTDHPGQHYAATVASTAHALDATSRTLQVELQIDNNGGELLPGAYVQVSFSLTPTAGNLRVPVNAVIFRGKAPQVATVDAGHRVRLHDITEGRDFGTEIEVLAGVGPDDTVILNPPDSIADGTEVRLQPPQAQPAPPQAGSGRAVREHS